MDSALGAVAATLGNIGPGIGAVGPVENYFHIPVFGKWFELFTVLVLLAPAFWKK